MNISKTIKRMMTAAAIGATIATGATGIAHAGDWKPATIVETSPAGRMSAPSQATTYLCEGRTRVTLPDDVIAEINAWADAYSERLADWESEDGEDFAAYYGGLEEGFSYATQTILARLGYLDAFYRDGDSTVLADPDATLLDAPDTWDSETFFAYETASFGTID